MLKEFKEFAIRGNVIDMAVGVIIGGAFGKIVASLVNDVIMPPLGLLVSQVNFSSICIDLRRWRFDNLDAAKAAGIPTLNLGLFVNTVIDFVIQALVIFMFVKAIQRLKVRTPSFPAPVPVPAPVAPPVKNCPFCCSQIPINAIRCPNCTSDLKIA